MRIPVCEPSIGEKELANVVEAVKSGWISGYQGKFIDEFEERFAQFCGCRYGVATTNCASAMLLALESLGIGKGDEVITTDFTMIATVSAIIHAGATPVLVDAEPDTWCMDATKVEERVTPRTRAIMPVTIYGHPVDINALIKVAERHKLVIIEDAAEAIGARQYGFAVGALSDVACFSYYINKTIVTGEGGMLVTDDEELASVARRLRGYDTDPNNRFIHRLLGFNYRMCLPAGTKVLISKPVRWRNRTGSGVAAKLIPTPIENVRVGDQALSFNETTGKKELRKVTGTCTRTDNDLMRLVFSNGNELVLTSNHPVFVPGRGWVEARSVQIGDSAIQYNYLALRWRLCSLAKRGLTWEETLGVERAARIKRANSKRFKELRRDPTSAYNTSPIFNSAATHKKHGNSLRITNKMRNLYPPERRSRISDISRRMWANPLHKIRSQESLDKRAASCSNTMLRKMRDDPVFAAEQRSRAREAAKLIPRKPTKLERNLLSILSRGLPDTYKYVGNGKFWIEGANPDFIDVNGYKKAIEVYSPYWKIRDYGSIANYQKQRSSLFRRYGWDVLFVEAKRRISNPDAIIKQVRDFTYNPHTEVVTVVAKESVPGAHAVFNLDIEHNNNFYAYGILVHNTNIQAAIGCAQMDRIDQFIAKKREIAQWYRAGLAGMDGVTLPVERLWAVNGYWVFGILLESEEKRDGVVKRLAAAGVETRNFFHPMHDQPALPMLWPKDGETFPVATDIGRRGLYLPNGVTLTEEQAEYVCQELKRTLRA